MLVQVCTDMGVEAPIPVSMKLGDIGNLFRRIVDAAQRPHLSIPETEAGRSHKHYRRLIQRSLTVAAGMSCIVFADMGMQLSLHVLCKPQNTWVFERCSIHRNHLLGRITNPSLLYMHFISATT